MALGLGYRIWAEIDLDRLGANVRALRAQAGPARLLAVIKGNAYGHGAIAVAKAAVEAGAWGLGVVDVEEGVALRAAAIEAPVLVLGASSPRVAKRLVEAGLRATVGSLALAEALSETAVVAGREAVVHVKVETGLNRYGLLPDEAIAFAERLRSLPNLVVEGLSTHFASVDEGDREFTSIQYTAFRDAAERLAWIPIHHVSSTGALLELPELGLGMVRAGMGLYGYYPWDGGVNQGVRLLPVLALRSRIARVQTLAPGETVGYARTWRAARPSRVATVMAGYADGVRRVLSNKGLALVRGRRAPFAGRVAMDMLMLDVTDIPDVRAEEEVTLIGRQGEAEISAHEVGSLSGTIAYEVLAGIMPRVPRLYLRAGCIVACQDLAGYRELPDL